VTSKELLVALHDVTPAHARRLETLYTLLEEFGVRTYALLVVPNWHGEWPLENFAEETASLRTRAMRGAEIVLHGWRHDEAGQPRSLAHRLRTWGHTDREGEFASLPPVEASARITRGLATLRACALEPIGFVPPAWLSGPGLGTIVHNAALAFTEDTRAVYLVATGRRILAPASCWSTRRAWRSVASVAVAAARVPLERSLPLVRLAFHPHDVDSPAVLASCRRTLAALLKDRRVIGYTELLRRDALQVAEVDEHKIALAQSRPQRR
jgi:predicted deacetylase